MNRVRALRRLIVVGATLLPAACLPYSVGSTAQPVPIGDVAQHVITTWVIDGAAPFNDSTETLVPTKTFVSADAEIRKGVSTSTDLGLRIVAGSGVVLSAKHRQLGAAHPDSAALSTLVGFGFLNAFNHAHLEAALLVSARKRGSGVPYAGLRYMQSYPIARDALSDDPTLGGFVGVRFGRFDFSVTPEVAVYHDRSVTGLRRGEIVIAPSITFTGIKIPRISFPERPPPRPQPRPLP